MSEPFNSYLRECKQQLGTGLAREHAYRPALKNLLSALHPTAVIINDPARIACGAPDFILLRDNVPFGYIEAKDMGNDLAETAASDQLRRYRDSLSNLILTNYLDFQWYVGGELRAEASLGRKRGNELTADKAGSAAVASLLAQFFSQEGEPLGTAEELAKRMAHLARLMKEAITQTVAQEGQNGPFHAQHQAFQATLIPGLQADEFADMYAQTLTYGLFAARVRAADTGGVLTRESIPAYLPSTNPFLRRFFYQISGPDMPVTVSWLVDDLAQTLRRADMHAILRQFGQRTRQEDPIIHFYETFLREYDPKLRQSRGVYYTPEPVVSYIVRSLDAILQSHFGRPLGLADPQTLILDPATGTGTFLYFVIQHIYDKLHSMGQAGSWNSYVQENLLPRLFGFELLMAPYAVAHLKLGVLLRELGYQFESNERLNVFLTNALSEPVVNTQTLGFAGFLSQEGALASEVKQGKPIMVVLGNPPYSVSSTNNNPYINELMDSYKVAVRSERNIQPLSDDYIKFIRLAHDRIEKTGYGVVAMITNNSYLSGVIHRGVREELLKTFDFIYILNLHGSALVSRGIDSNIKDENVFDIQQGVSIVMFVKKQRSVNQLASVKYADLWGTRSSKYTYLFQEEASSQNWIQLNPSKPHYFFVTKDFNLQDEYESFFNITQVFPNLGTAAESRKDKLWIAFSEHELRERLEFFSSVNTSPKQVEDLLEVESTDYWQIKEVQEIVAKESISKFVVPILYRPFDWRHIYYNPQVIPRGSHSYPTMKHLIHPNLGLIVSRLITHNNFYDSVLVTNTLGEKKVGNSTRSSSIVPLYLYTTAESTKGTLFATNTTTRKPNLAPEFISQVEETLGLSLVIPQEFTIQPPTTFFQSTNECPFITEPTFTPEDIFYYTYALFHSPTYRTRYAEFLKIDFPRLPLTASVPLFRQLAVLGHQLVQLHLLTSPALNTLQTRFPQGGSNSVEKGHPRYVEPTASQAGRVYINKTQFFEGVDKSVWEMQIGGYQPLQKWLKDRIGRTLSFDELMHYQRIALALAQTQQHMQTIDGLLPTWPLA
ncbi:MAG: N-6 DNA methylase [Chloroflexi bacterium]|nr:N-6 DNA methylase [Chloroflexota bacterium]